MVKSSFDRSCFLFLQIARLRSLSRFNESFLRRISQSGCGYVGVMMHPAVGPIAGPVFILIGNFHGGKWRRLSGASTIYTLLALAYESAFDVVPFRVMASFISPAHASIAFSPFQAYLMPYSYGSFLELRVGDYACSGLVPRCLRC